jgi:hypothetical protein
MVQTLPGPIYWWAFAYSIAGYTGAHFQQKEFLFGAGVSLALFSVIVLLSLPGKHSKPS